MDLPPEPPPPEAAADPTNAASSPPAPPAPPTPPTPATRRRGPLRRWLRRLVWALCVALVLGACALFYALGHLGHPLVKARVQALAYDLAGARVDYDDGSVGLAAFELRGLRVANADDDAALVGDLVRVGRIHARYDALAALRGPAIVDALQVEDVAVGVVAGGDGGSSLARALRLPEAATPTEPTRPSRALDALAVLEHAGLADGSIGPIELRLAHVGALPLALRVGGLRVHLRASAHAQRGAEVHVRVDGAAGRLALDSEARDALLRAAHAAALALPEAATAVAVGGRDLVGWLDACALPWRADAQLSATLDVTRAPDGGGTIELSVSVEALRGSSAAIADAALPLGARLVARLRAVPAAGTLHLDTLRVVGLRRAGDAFIPLDNEADHHALFELVAVVDDATQLGAPPALRLPSLRLAVGLASADDDVTLGPLRLRRCGALRAALTARDLGWPLTLAPAATATVDLDALEVGADGVAALDVQGAHAGAHLRVAGEDALALTLQAGVARAALEAGPHAATLSQARAQLSASLDPTALRAALAQPAERRVAASLAALGEVRASARADGLTARSGALAPATNGDGVGDDAPATARVDRAHATLRLWPATRRVAVAVGADGAEASVAGARGEASAAHASVAIEGARARALGDADEGFAKAELAADATALEGQIAGAALAATAPTARLELAGAALADGSLVLDGAEGKVGGAALSFAGRRLGKDSRAALTLRRLALPLASPEAAQLGRLLAEARLPGLMGLLELSVGASLRWRAEAIVSAPKTVAALAGVPWPRGVALASARLRSAGALDGAAALARALRLHGLAGLAGGRGDALLSALRIEHDSSLSLAALRLPTAQGPATLRELGASLAGKGAGLDHTHRYAVAADSLRVGVAAAAARVDRLDSSGELRVSGRGLRLHGLDVAGSLRTDGVERATYQAGLERGPTWTLRAGGKLGKLGRLAAVLSAAVPCLDGSRLAGEAELLVRVAAPPGDDPRHFLAWLDAPKRARFTAEGSAALSGLRCHQPSFGVDAPTLRGALRAEVGRGRVEAVVTGALARASASAGRHAVKARGFEGSLTLSGPLDARLRGLDVRGKAKLSRLDHDLLAGYRVADVEASVVAHIDGAGRLDIERAAFANPGGGTHGWLRGRVDRIGLIEDAAGATSDGVPGARGAALSGELSQDLGVPGELFGVRGGGKGKLSFTVESGDFRLLAVRARATLDDVSLVAKAFDVELRGARGEIPFAFDIAVDEAGLRPLGGGRRSAWARWRYEDQHPFLPGEAYVSLQSLRWRTYTLGPLAANLSVDRDVLHLDQLELQALGGQITGQCVIELDGDKTRVLLRGNATGLRIEGKQGRIDANAALVIEPWQLAIEGRAQLLRMSREHLEVMLDAFDPFREDLQASRARLALKLGYPKQARLRFRHGFADVLIELGGLAELVRIDEIRGVPLGPLMGRYVTPLLGAPPP